jgi:hypothetical protein
MKRLLAIVALLIALTASPVLAASDGVPGPCVLNPKAHGSVHNGPASDNVSAACDRYTAKQAEKAAR